MQRVTVTSQYVTRAIIYKNVSTERLSVGIVAICAVDQRVDVVLTRHMMDSTQSFNTEVVST